MLKLNINISLYIHRDNLVSCGNKGGGGGGGEESVKEMCVHKLPNRKVTICHLLNNVSVPTDLVKGDTWVRVILEG